MSAINTSEYMIFTFRFGPEGLFASFPRMAVPTSNSPDVWINLVSFNGITELSLVSFGKTIAVRRRCKEEECESCLNKFNCIGEKIIFTKGEGRTEEVITDEQTRVKYIVTDMGVPTRGLKSARQAQRIQTHIKLVLSMLSRERNQEYLLFLTKPDPDQHISIHPHKSMIYPIVKTVDWWANEVNPYTLTM